MARFLTEKKALIQHMPRTGGTWIESAIGILGLQHSKWLEKQPLYLPRKHSLYQHYFRNQLERIDYIFVVVRHPKAYYESTWKWLNCKIKRDELWTDWRWHPQASAARCWKATKESQGQFCDWVAKMLEEEPLWYTRLVESYVGPEGGEFVDFIARTETLASDFLKFLDMIGYGDIVTSECLMAVKCENTVLNLPPINVAPAVLYWEPSVLASVLESERLVIRRFYQNEERCYASLADPTPIRKSYARRAGLLNQGND